VSQQVAGDLCRWNGPFSSVELLSRPGAAEVLSYLAEIDANAVAQLLESVIGDLSREELLLIDSGVRRHLVYALEKIAFRGDTFDQAADLLLDLAVAENEQFGNNATGVFKGLFPVLGGATEAGPEARFRVLDEALASDEPERRGIAVDTLLSGADTAGSGFRIVGAEQHGNRPPLAPWQPTLLKDAWEYVRECLNRLAVIATGSDAIAAQAKAGIGHHFRNLIARGSLDIVEELFETVVHGSGAYWPEARGSLGDVLVYDGEGLALDAERRVRTMISRLNPSNAVERVRFLVTEMPWHYPDDERLEHAERERRQLTDIDALVTDLLRQAGTLAGFFSQLSKGEHRMVVAFGTSIARQAADPAVWSEPILDAYRSSPPDERNSGLLAGYFIGLADRCPTLVEDFKEGASKSEVLAPALPYVCLRLGITGKRCLGSTFRFGG
jgi:hypothetical protein